MKHRITSNLLSSGTWRREYQHFEWPAVDGRIRLMGIAGTNLPSWRRKLKDRRQDSDRGKSWEVFRVSVGEGAKDHHFWWKVPRLRPITFRRSMLQERKLGFLQSENLRPYWNLTFKKHNKIRLICKKIFCNIYDEVPVTFVLLKCSYTTL